MTERDTAGYLLWRAVVGDGSTPARSSATLVTPRLIESTGAGEMYEWLDQNTLAGTTYAYWLNEVDANGNFTEYGPVVIRVDGAVSDEPAPLPPIKPARRFIRVMAE